VAGAPRRARRDINDIEHAPNVSAGSDVNTEATTTSTTRRWPPERRLANLQLLCPNCHSQTENFAGRNRGRSVQPADEHGDVLATVDGGGSPDRS